MKNLKDYIFGKRILITGAGQHWIPVNSSVLNY